MQNQSQTFMGSKLQHLLIVFFFQEVPSSSVCVILLTNKQTEKRTNIQATSIRKIIPNYFIHITLSNLFDYHKLIFVTRSYRIYHSLVAVSFLSAEKSAVSATILAN